MQNRLVHTLGALIFGGMLAVPPEVSAGYLVGGTLTVMVDDSPLGTNFTQNVTLSPGTTTLDQGEMTLTQSLAPSGPGAQWLVLDFEATGGKLLANPTSFWQIGADTPLSSPGGFTGAFAYWSVNGAPTNPINPFGSGFIAHVGTDPIDSSISPVYVELFPGPIVTGTTSLDLSSLVFASPYSVISEGGMDPNAVNGFVIGLQVTNTAVPEPSSFYLGAIGVVAAGGFALARRRSRPRR